MIKCIWKDRLDIKYGKEKETKLNKDGTYTITEVIETTPEDGFVHQPNINKMDIDNYGEFHKGYQKNISVTTSDPRITRPFAYGICGIFLAIGLLMLVFKSYFFGLLFILIATFAFLKSKKDIDNIEKELAKNSNYSQNDKTVVRELSKEVGEKFNNVTSSTFTRNKFNNFIKVSLTIYIIISAITAILISIFISIFLGIFILIILILSGLFYYIIVSKICKH